MVDIGDGVLTLAGMNLIEAHKKITADCSTLPDGAKVKVNGFVFLSKLEDGRTYTVRRDEARGVYWFCSPRSGRKVVGHYFDQVDFGLRCFARGDLNGLQALEVVTNRQALQAIAGVSARQKAALKRERAAVAAKAETLAEKVAALRNWDDEEFN